MTEVKNQSAVGERAEATSLSAINKLIGTISKSANKLNEEIHNCALMCIKHAQNYGDATAAGRLVDAMPKSFRRGLVIQWFAANSPITVSKNAKTDAMKAHLAGKAEERQWDIDAAAATPFFAMPEADREPDVPTYESLHKNIVDFIERMNKRADKIEDPKEAKAAKEEIEALKTVIPVAA